MKEFKIETKIMTYALSELPDEDLPLMNAAIKATEHSYAPYSKFHVSLKIARDEYSWLSFVKMRL